MDAGGVKERVGCRNRTRLGRAAWQRRPPASDAEPASGLDGFGEGYGEEGWGSCQVWVGVKLVGESRADGAGAVNL